MAITIDITKAKEVWKNKIRYKRKDQNIHVGY